MLTAFVAVCGFAAGAAVSATIPVPWRYVAGAAYGSLSALMFPTGMLAAVAVGAFLGGWTVELLTSDEGGPL